MYSIDIRIKWLWFDLSSGDNYPTEGCHFVLLQRHTTACFASLPPSLPTWWIIGWWRLIFLFEGRNRTNAYAVVPALTYYDWVLAYWLTKLVVLILPRRRTWRSLFRRWTRGMVACCCSNCCCCSSVWEASGRPHDEHPSARFIGRCRVSNTW